MEFDKTRVYTAVNAEELPIGSRCIFADRLRDLYKHVENEQGYVKVLTAVLDDNEIERFEADYITFSLAYLIELPKEPEYKPFSDLVVAMEAIKKHGGWVQEHLKIGENQYFITAFNFEFDNVDEIFFNNSWHSRDELFNDFFFADDGTPCGELVEE